MFELLQVSRTNYYKYTEPRVMQDPQTQRVCRLFQDNRKSYGTRRLRAACSREDVIISKRRLQRIMCREGLVSTYTVAAFKIQAKDVNESTVTNIVDRAFDGRKPCEVIVSDLTYVRVAGKWNYICTIVDLHNRQIIGYSCGAHKTAQLVMEAFASIPEDLKNIGIFHTYRGSEFKNKVLDEFLTTFSVTRSLSHKGTPCDNAVAEATYKTIKVEFVYQEVFVHLEQLCHAFGAYVWWFNNQRLHSTLGYLPPVEFKLKHSLGNLST